MTVRKTVLVSGVALFIIAAVLAGDFLIHRHFESRRLIGGNSSPSASHVGLQGIFGARPPAILDTATHAVRPGDLDAATDDDSDLRLFPFKPRASDIALLNEIPTDFASPKAADAGAPPSPPAGETAGAPQSISHPADASPIAAQGAGGNGITDDARKVIEQELPDSSREEHDIWAESLDKMSPTMIRDIMQIRRKFAPRQHPPALGSALAHATPPAPDGAKTPAVPSPLPPSVPPLLPTVEKLPSGTNDVSLDELQSTIAALHQACGVILNNIANASTTGFKRSRVLFQDLPNGPPLLTSFLNDRATTAQRESSVGQGIEVATVQRDHAQGRLLRTGNRLDLAIVGDGFFQIQGDKETLYTRTGTFMLEECGNFVLVASGNCRLLKPSINIPQDALEISISSDGMVSIMQPNQTGPSQIGQIQLARFINPSGLVQRGERLYSNGSAGTPQLDSPGTGGIGTLKQRYIESSNVNLRDELADLKRLHQQLEAIRAAAAIMSAGATRSGANSTAAD